MCISGRLRQLLLLTPVPAYESAQNSSPKQDAAGPSFKTTSVSSV